MSTIINTRSPYYFKVHNASLYKAKLQLYVWTGVTGDKDLNTDLRYTISKQEIGTNNFVVFELSQLIRDYMETEYNDYGTGLKLRKRCVNGWQDLDLINGTFGLYFIPEI